MTSHRTTTTPQSNFPSPSLKAEGSPSLSSDLLSRLSLPDSALLLMSTLENCGFETWVVGGYVRDALLGRPGNDIDIATNAHWREVQDVCSHAGMNVYETGAAHGTVTVTLPTSLPENKCDLSPLNSHPSGRTPAVPLDSSDSQLPLPTTSTIPEMRQSSFEVTTYRHDGSYDDARHPRNVEFVPSIEEDLERRDFTINALAYHPARGLLDPFGGLDDLQAGVIRAVGNPAKRFSEDALRILRACRFASQLGFTLDTSTYQAMVSHKHLLSKISAERVIHELDALLIGNHAGKTLLETVDVLSFVLPELTAMKGCPQRTKYHVYDVLEHTARVVDYSQPRHLNRWAALCHDMGKPASAFLDDKGVEHFYGHAKLSEVMASSIMSRLKASNSLKSRVAMLVKYHDADFEANPRNVRRLLLHLDGDVELFRALCDLKRADALAHAPAYRQEGVDIAEQLLVVLDDVLSSEGTPSLSMLAVNGDDVMALGVSEGPEVGRVLNTLFSDVIDERIPNKRDALLDAARKLVRQSGKTSG